MSMCTYIILVGVSVGVEGAGVHPAVAVELDSHLKIEKNLSTSIS